MKRLVLTCFLFALGLICLVQQPSKAWWQSVPQQSVGGGASAAFDAFGAVAALGDVNITADYNNLTIGASANYIIVFVSVRVPALSVVNDVTWDPAGANQSMTLMSSGTVTFGGANSTMKAYSLANPGSTGAKTIRLTYSTNSTFNSIGVAAYSFTGAASATVGGTTGQSGSAVANRTGSITVGAGHVGVLTAFSDNGLSSSVTFSTNDSELSSRRMGIQHGTGTVSLTITPDVNEICGDLDVDVSP